MDKINWRASFEKTVVKYFKIKDIECLICKYKNVTYKNVCRKCEGQVKIDYESVHLQDYLVKEVIDAKT